MAKHADLELGVHQGRRRILEIESGEIAIFNQNIAAGGFFDSNELYAPGFTHFAGQFATDTPIATTLSIRLIPRLAGSLGGGGTPVTDEFVVALITTFVGLNRYSFYWGEARGLAPGPPAASGATYCFSPLFRLRIRNAGANPANTTTVEAIVCQ
jgi:hypothetical protein